ncbi:hypothetical protein D6779_04995 [Candidatus Parcubacteria bacterium]|nr:MAG: hypothetical protein D6779_04995 [Candidatus Parcubacteria bacterium]
MLPLIVIRMLRMYLSRVLHADSQFKLSAIVNSSMAIMRLIICTFLVLMGKGLVGIIVGFYLADTYGLIFLLFLITPRYPLLTGNMKKVFIASKDTLRFCSLIFIPAIVVFLDTKIDVFLVNFYLEKEDVAVYAYAIEFALILTLIGDTISQVNFPRLSMAFSNSNNGEVQRIYARSIRLSFFVISSLAMVFLFLSPYIIAIILPSNYLAMLPLLNILLVGIVPFSAISSVGTIMTSRGKPAYDALPVSISLIVNVGLSVFLIPSFGMVGAAVSTTISFLIRVILGCMMIEKYVGTNFQYGRIIVAYSVFIVIVFSVLQVGHTYFLEILGTLVYIIFCWRIALSASDREVVNKYFVSRLA